MNEAKAAKDTAETWMQLHLGIEFDTHAASKLAEKLKLAAEYIESHPWILLDINGSTKRESAMEIIAAVKEYEQRVEKSNETAFVK